MQWNRTLIVMLVFISLIVAAAPGFGQKEQTEAELKQYLDIQEAVYENICIEMGTARWSEYSGEGKSDIVTPRKHFAELFGDSMLNETIDNWYAKKDRIVDPYLKRRVEEWHNILMGAKVDYDPEVVSLVNQIEAVLGKDTSKSDRATEKDKEKMIMKLVVLRNREARKYGFHNYAEMVFQVSELDYDWLNKFIKTVDRKTEAPYRVLVKKYKQKEKKTEIGFDDMKALTGRQQMEAISPKYTEDKMMMLIKETLKNIGVDYDSLPMRVVTKMLPGGMGGNGLAIRIPNDFRVVIIPELRLGGRMHELGHGLQWMNTTVSSPVLKGYEWMTGSSCAAFQEGMADVGAKFVQNEEWKKKYAGATDEDLKTRNELLRTYEPAIMRQQLLGAIIELEMYKNPEQDVKALATTIAKKFLLLNKPMDPDFISGMYYIFVNYPLYLQNYLIGDAIGWQVHQMLAEKFGKDYFLKGEVIGFLKKNLYENGELYSWQVRLKRATGKELDVEAFLKERIKK